MLDEQTVSELRGNEFNSMNDLHTVEQTNEREGVGIRSKLNATNYDG